MKIRHGNLLDAEGFIVHGCNAQGVMGSGIAKQIRDRWPGAYEVYRKEYENYGLKVGTNTYYRVDNKIIVNAVTQEFYGRDPNVVYVDYEAIISCFMEIGKYINGCTRNNPYCIILPRVINFPMIGCGLANGDWGRVSNLIDGTLNIVVKGEIEKVLWIYE